LQYGNEHGNSDKYGDRDSEEREHFKTRGFTEASRFGSKRLIVLASVFVKKRVD
jgi:hypothetical protein